MTFAKALTLFAAMTFTGCVADNDLIREGVQNETPPQQTEGSVDSSPPDRTPPPDMGGQGGPDMGGADMGGADMGGQGAPDMEVSKTPELPLAVEGDPCLWEDCEGDNCTRSSYTSPEVGRILDLKVTDKGFLTTGMDQSTAVTTLFNQDSGWEFTLMAEGYGKSLVQREGTFTGIARSSVENTLLLTTMTAEGEVLTTSAVSGNYHPLKVLATPDGYVALISVGGNRPTYENTGLYGVSPEGEILWTQETPRGYDLVSTHNGFAMVKANGTWNTQIITFSYEGEVLQTFTLPGIESDGARRIVTTLDGGFITSTDNSGQRGPSIQYTDSEGRLHWTVDLERKRLATALTVAPEGIYVAGEANILDDEGFEELFLSRVSAEGDLVEDWILQPPNPLNDSEAAGLKTLPQGGVVLYGRMDHRRFWQVWSPEGACPH